MVSPCGPFFVIFVSTVKLSPLDIFNLLFFSLLFDDLSTCLSLRFCSKLFPCDDFGSWGIRFSIIRKLAFCSILVRASCTTYVSPGNSTHSGSKSMTWNKLINIKMSNAFILICNSNQSIGFWRTCDDCPSFELRDWISEFTMLMNAKKYTIP